MPGPRVNRKTFLLVYVDKSVSLLMILALLHLDFLSFANSIKAHIMRCGILSCPCTIFLASHLQLNLQTFMKQENLTVLVCYNKRTSTQANNNMISIQVICIPKCSLSCSSKKYTRQCFGVSFTTSLPSLFRNADVYQ